MGTCLDVGAFDGIQNSNTYALHKVMGWRGVNVEIDSDNFEKLARNRRDDMPMSMRQFAAIVTWFTMPLQKKTRLQGGYGNLQMIVIVANGGKTLSCTMQFQ